MFLYLQPIKLYKDLDLVINFTPTGMVPTKEMSQFVPISVNEIVDQTLEVYEEGITLVHLHARDEIGKPTYKKDIYFSIIEKIKCFAPDLVICVSLSGRNYNEFEKRSEALELNPDMASLTLSSLNFAKQASINDPEMIGKLLEKMKHFGVNPELEIFDLGMINYANFLIDRNMIDSPYYFNIIFGNIAGIQLSPSAIAAVFAALPTSSIWAFGGIGPQQLSANAISIALGGGVRVGLEDNLYLNDKKSLTSNLKLIQRIKELATIHGRTIMSPKTFGDLGFYNKLIQR